jgi:hypothetical protein
MLDVLGVASEPGSPGRPNDDAAGSAGRFAWVIDGATGLGDEQLLDGPSDAAWLAGALDLALHAAAETATDAADLLAAAVAEAERRFLAERRRPPAARWEIPTAAVLVVEALDDAVAVVELGDCAVYVAAGGHLARFGGTEAGRAGEVASARRFMTGGGGRTAEVLQHLRAVRERANAPGGYPVIAPDATTAAAARHHRVACRSANILLMTDGYEAAVDDYGLYTRAGLLEAALADIQAPIAALRAVEVDDPACTRYPRFKPSDDATALVARMAGAHG